MHPIDLAQFWPGYEVVACRQATHDTLLIELEPQAGSIPKCGRCHQACPLIHERRIRQVRDRDLLDQRVLLQLPVRRVDCLDCGRVTERIDWLAPASRLTQRLRVWLEGLLQLLPISHVSRLTGLHWHTLKQLDKRRLEAAVGAFEPAHQRPRGCEQPHQGDQTHGLWLPGLSLLLPEDQGRLPRESAMNQKMPPCGGE